MTQRRLLQEEFCVGEGPAVFLLVWTTLDDMPTPPVTVNVTVYEVAGWQQQDNGPDEALYGDLNDMATEITEATEQYLEAYIQWDGCSTFHFQPGLHLCGPHNWAQLMVLMQHLWKRAFQLMEREPDDEWPLAPLNFYDI